MKYLQDVDFKTSIFRTEDGEKFEMYSYQEYMWFSTTAAYVKSLKTQEISQEDAEAVIRGESRRQDAVSC